MATAEDVRAVAEPVLADQGLELWDVEITGGILRFLVDREGGVDLDALTAASGALSPMLDQHPEITPTGPYQLEVSSPGLERSLRTPDQYRRYVGSEVTIKTAGPVAGSRRHRGRLVSATEDAVTVEVEADLLELRYGQIERTRTVLVWPTPAARPKRTPSRAVADQRPKDPRP